MVDYVLSVIPIAFFFAIVSFGGVLLWGLYRFPAMSLGAFFGVGAYAAALLIGFGIEHIIALVLATVVAAVAGWLLGATVQGVARDAAVVCTFALQVCLGSLFLNWTAVTGGSMGIGGLSHEFLSFLPFRFEGKWVVTSVAAVVFAQATYIVLQRSRFSITVSASGESEHLSSGFGIPPRMVSGTVFAVSHGWAGFSGALFALYVGYIHPSNFGVSESIFVLAIVAAAGTRSYLYALALSILMVGLPEAVRFLDADILFIEKVRACIVGSVLLAVVWIASASSGGEDMEDSERDSA